MKKFLTFFLSFLALFLLVITPVFAQDDQPKKEQRTVVVEENEVINKDPYFATGDVVEIHGRINGDTYIGAGEIIIDGVINGDLIVAGGNIRISGEVTQDLRAAGGQMTIDANVGRNTTLAGGNISIEKSSQLHGYVIVAGGNITITAPVNGNLKVAGGNVSVLSSVNGDLDAAVGMLRLGPEAKVSGNVTYFSEETANIDKNATVSGEIVQRTPPPELAEGFPKTIEEKTRLLTGAALTVKIISALSIFIIGLLLIKLFPGYTEATSKIIDKKPWASLGVGFLTLIATPIAIIILLITIIGIPLALILLFIYLIYIYLAKIAVIIWAGEKLFPKTKLLISFVIAIIIYEIVTLIPPLAGLVKFIMLLFGLGAMVLSCKEVYLSAKKNKLF